jgi:hypothetical protein
MQNYRDNAAPIVRVTYGDELVARAQALYPANTFAAALAQLDDEMFEQVIAILRSQRKAGQERGKVGVAEFLLEQEVRRTLTRCEDQDGGRGGYVAGLVFPDGLKDEVQPQGQGQADATAELLTRMRNTRDERAQAVVQTSLPAVEQGLTQLQDALRARDAADAETAGLYDAVQGLGQQHRTQVDAAIGLVRAAFPGDRRKQDAIFPESEAPARKPVEAAPGPVPAPLPA